MLTTNSINKSEFCDGNVGKWTKTAMMCVFDEIRFTYSILSKCICHYWHAHLAIIFHYLLYKPIHSNEHMGVRFCFYLNTFHAIFERKCARPRDKEREALLMCDANEWMLLITGHCSSFYSHLYAYHFFFDNYTNDLTRLRANVLGECVKKDAHAANLCKILNSCLRMLANPSEYPINYTFFNPNGQASAFVLANVDALCE